MKLKLIPVLLDLVFVFSASLIASFAVLRFYIDSLLASIIIALIFALLTTSLFRNVYKKRNASYTMKAHDREKMDETLTSLCLMTDYELKTFFTELLKRMQITANEDDNGLYLSKSNAEVRFYFTFSKPNEGRIIEFYKRAEKGHRLIVLGREFSEELTELTARFAGRIQLIDGANLYLLMKRYNLFPPQKENLKKPKTRINLPRTLLSKRRARQYFLYGLTLEFFSFFVFFPVYYVCFGAALILLAIVCYFFGIKDEPKAENPFGEQ